jgi:hypothetical protein
MQKYQVYDNWYKDNSIYNLSGGAIVFPKLYRRRWAKRVVGTVSGFLQRKFSIKNLFHSIILPLQILTVIFTF